MKYKENRKQKSYINFEDFKNIKKPEIAYLLGLIWADGYVSDSCIRITMKKEDIETLHDSVFSKTGKWMFHDIEKEGNRKIQRCYNVSNKQLCKFLKELDYVSNTNNDFKKILNLIPETLHMYFYRGLSDGDGCFYYGVSPFFSFTSHYEQSWESVEKLFQKLNLKYSIRRNIINPHNSLIRSKTWKDAILFGDYIYKENVFGLNRKYQKYILMKNNFKEKLKTSKYVGVYKFGEKWCSNISTKYIKKHLGTFDNENDANFARLNYLSLIDSLKIAHVQKADCDKIITAKATQYAQVGGSIVR